jgi:hypothetical protein
MLGMLDYTGRKLPEQPPSGGATIRLKKRGEQFDDRGIKRKPR